MAILKTGDRIGNYLLEEQVGRGSFGEVWRAKHHVFDESVAIKVPTDADYVRNLQREGVAIHGLRHPNIVRALDMDPYAVPPYLIMEYVAGPSLRQLIDNVGTSFPIQAAERIMRGILSALDYAHEQGLVHRDIKPANILLNHPSDSLDSIDELAVKVTDFGLGRVGGATTQSILQSGLADDDGKLAGTVAYMSPEQRSGQDVDGRSDLFACGCVLFEMLTGERPTGGDLPSSVRESVPTYLDEVFRKAYTRVDRRFASAGAMIEALGRGGQARPVRHDRHAPAVPPPPHGAPPPLPPPPGHAYAMTVCTRCGNRADRGDNFCIRCGTQVVAQVPRCRSCGEYVQLSDKFCIRCGTSLTVLA